MGKGGINLKVLKSFISYSQFKMEDFVKRSVEGEQFYAQGGPGKSYFCVPLHKNHQKFLPFQWKGNIYKFLCLCFGLDPAPRIFPKLLKIPIAVLRRIQIRIIIYLDDMLLMSQTINSLEIARDRLIFLLSSLSFVINLQKSVLVLLQNIVSRSGNRIGENDINTTAGKSKKIEIEMLKAYFKSQNDIIGSDQPFRFCLLNSTGSATSYATNQVFTSTANSSYKKQSLLPVCNVSEAGLYSGTAVVVQQHRDL